MRDSVLPGSKWRAGSTCRPARYTIAFGTSSTRSAVSDVSRRWRATLGSIPLRYRFPRTDDGDRPHASGHSDGYRALVDSRYAALGHVSPDRNPASAEALALVRRPECRMNATSTPTTWMIVVGAVLQLLGYTIAAWKLAQTRRRLIGPWRPRWVRWALVKVLRRSPRPVDLGPLRATATSSATLDMVVGRSRPAATLDDVVNWAEQRFEDLERLIARRNEAHRVVAQELRNKIAEQGAALATHAAEERQQPVREFRDRAPWEFASLALFALGLGLSVAGALS
jgi:hypothetical protein